MSRRFIDDHIELQTNTIAGLPSQDNQYYNPAHFFSEPVSGLRFVNEGPNDRLASLFVTERYNALVFYEDFRANLPALAANGTIFGANPLVSLAGTNAANAQATFQTANGNQGGVLLTTTTSSNDQEILIPNTNSSFGQQSFFVDNSVVFETQIVTDASIANTVIWAGLKLTNTSVTATDNDQTFFRYQDGVNNGNFQVIDSNNNVDNVNDSTITAATGSAYHLKIVVSGVDLLPRYYINGVLVGTGLALRTGQVLKPYVGVQTTTTAARKVTCRFVRTILARNPVAID